MSCTEVQSPRSTVNSTWNILLAGRKYCFPFKAGGRILFVGWKPLKAAAINKIDFALIIVLHLKNQVLQFLQNCNSPY